MKSTYKNDIFPAFKNINLCALLSFLLTFMLLCSQFFQVIYFILLLFYFVIILLRFLANFDIKGRYSP